MESSDTKLSQLRILLAEAHDLDRAAELLEWDQQTYMPRRGVAARAEQTATLRQLAHEHFTSPEVGRLLDELSQNGLSRDYDSDEASLVRVNHRDFERKRRVPGELVAEMARAEGQAEAAWEQAKAQSDFAILRPHLQRIVDLKRRWAECFQPDDLYDPLLQEYEPGMTTAEVRSIFADIKAGLVPLVQAIAQRADAVDDACLQRDYPEQAQWDFGLEVLRLVGFDLEAGRLDRSAHPFTSSAAIGDVRLTTRVQVNSVSNCLYSCLHEAGHGLYEQGITPSLERTWLDGGASLGAHESQSRLWENRVGRSRAFWQFLYPRMRAVFPQQLSDQDAESMYRAVNKVQPSLIRTEADEVTYDLHIMLRFELEQAMLAGSLDLADLPEIWNAHMREYLGVTPPNDAQGVLQDIHWADGLFGYFATYSLGNVMSAQIYEQAARELPDLDAQYASGEFRPLLDWLREKIYRHGRKFTAPELAQRVTGRPVSTEPYLRYLREKFGALYGIEAAAA